MQAAGWRVSKRIHDRDDGILSVTCVLTRGEYELYVEVDDLFALRAWHSLIGIEWDGEGEAPEPTVTVYEMGMNEVLAEFAALDWVPVDGS